MWPPSATMSSGWIRCSVAGVPVPFGWKVCFSNVPKAICLATSVLGAALGLVLALGELELELEHPAAPSRLAATTMVPRQVAVRRLEMFTVRFVLHPSDVQRSGVERAVERLMTSRGPKPKALVNDLFSYGREACCARGSRAPIRGIPGRMGHRAAGDGLHAGHRVPSFVCAAVPAHTTNIVTLPGPAWSTLTPDKRGRVRRLSGSVWRGEVDRDVESAAVAEPDLHAGVVGGGYRPDDRQPEPVAVGLADPVAVQPLERLEQPLGLVQGDRRPGVADGEDRAPVHRLGTDLDPAVGPVVTDRVVD